MSLTFIKYPKFVELAGNNIAVEIEGVYTGQEVLDWGVLPKNAVHTITILFREKVSTIPNDDYVDFNFTATKNGVEVLNKTINIGDVYLSTDTLSQHVTKILNKFKAQPAYASAGLIFEKSGNDTILCYYSNILNVTWSTNEHTDYFIEVTKSTYLVDNINASQFPPRIGVNIQKSALVKIPSGQLIETYENYITKIERDGSHEMTSELEVTGRVSFDISGYLQTEEKYGHFTLGGFDPNYNWKKHDIVPKFRLFAYDIYGVEPQEVNGLGGNEFFVINASLSDYEKAKFNTLNQSFYQNLINTKRFLTNAPKTKYIDIYQPERLYFLNFYDTPKYFNIVAQIYYTDDTQEEKNLTKSGYQHLMAVGDLIELHCAFVNVYNVSNTTKSILKYNILIKENSSGTNLSETREYIIDRNIYPHARYFFALNSFNVYECFRTTGKLKLDSDIAKEFVNVTLPVNFTEFDKSSKLISQDENFVGELNSGFLSAEWHPHYRVLLKSPDVYWLKNGNAYPIEINKSSNPIRKDGELVNDYNFPIYVRNIDEDLYGALTLDAGVPIAGDFNFDFNEDFY